MADEAHVGLGPAGALKRPRFDAGDYLTASDLETEHAYRSQRLRRHNRHLHGWGVVCGLWVAPARDTARPWAVLVCPGYALGPYGHEMLVPTATLVDVRESLWSRPKTAGPMAYVGIRAAEHRHAPVVAESSGCGCDACAAHDSRVSDGWRIDILWELPPDTVSPTFDFCREQAPCPPCPDSPYVMLASIRLPLDESDPIDASAIDNSIRKTA